MYQYKCPGKKCKGFAAFQLRPARVQLSCPKCKTRQMIDSTPKYKCTKHFWDKEMGWFEQGNGKNFVGGCIVDQVDPADILKASAGADDD